MKKTVVIYSSKYGFTKRYAQWIAQALSCPLFEKKQFQAKNFENYDTVIYGGGLYAGGVSGIRLLIQNQNALAGKKVVLFTCGLADPAVPVNVAHIRKALEKALTPELLHTIHLFHLRGGISYSRLNLLHKSMMAMLRRALLKKAPSELTTEDALLLETYGKELDFTDQNSIQPLVSFVLADS